MKCVRAQERRVKYSLQNDGTFVIEQYDHAKPFASFFPGIAGLFGIPMWVFYVNRGQGIVSFGTEDKNHAMLEFFPANRAWQMVSSQGFRTVIKVSSATQEICYEPFRNDSQSAGQKIERRMFIRSASLGVQEINPAVGLKVDVTYYALNNEPLAAILRTVRVTNLSRTVKKLEIIDGLPQVVAYGISDSFLKDLGRTIEAWMQVQYVTGHEVPLYKIAVDPTDRPQVVHVKGGNFFYQWAGKGNALKPTGFLVDPAAVFGPMSDLQYPAQFFGRKFAMPARQQTRNKYPSALGHTRLSLAAGQSGVVLSVCGYASEEKYIKDIIDKLSDPAYRAAAEQRHEIEVDRIQQAMLTVSKVPAFDRYCQQTFLDNVLRGGYPLTFAAEGVSHVFHVYSRKHGDLERDYNNFLTEATYFSQGNGNYRDVNQNRRNDVWINPDVQESNLVSFFNLLQLDGFNPLVVQSARFRLNDPAHWQKCRRFFKNEADFEAVGAFVKAKAFVPGKLFGFLAERHISIHGKAVAFLRAVLGCCEKQEQAEHGDGFWVDHWTYNIDLIESFAGLYPERVKSLLFEKKCFVYFNNFVKVKPRAEKYVLYDGRVRQYHAVTLEEIKEDSELSRKIKSDDWEVRTDHGRGDIYRTSLLGKLLCLVANKMASFDPFGCGIEMEANKPGWYDSLNGLPALFGSSTCEVMELRRLIHFVRQELEVFHIDQKLPVAMPDEVHTFLEAVSGSVAAYLSAGQPDDMRYWEETASAKETFREAIKHGISGTEKMWRVADAAAMLAAMEEKVMRSIAKARDTKSGLYHTYFINEVAAYEELKDAATAKPRRSADGLVCVRPTKFKQIPLPLFLEGQVHALRIVASAAEARQLYASTRRSALYDRKLKMFKVNAPLQAMSEEIGRARIFTPGWLENESIWLHMEYKFIFELLRWGLYEEFFAEFKNVLIPFQPAERYGRSILENSSFLVSSAYPDESLHGNGFVARLSGSTAELISMWLWMGLGKEPFVEAKDKSLVLALEPILPKWLFTTEPRMVLLDRDSRPPEKVTIPRDCYACMFLGSILLVYHNPLAKDTFGSHGVKPCSYRLLFADGRSQEITGAKIPAPFAEQVRQRLVTRIDVELR